MRSKKQTSSSPFLLASCLCALAVSHASVADIDRLQPANSTVANNGQVPTVAPGSSLDDGVLIDAGTLIFGGVNSTTNTNELHGADEAPVDAAFVIRTSDDSSVTDVNDIVSFENGVAIAASSGIYLLQDAFSDAQQISAIGSSSLLATGNMLYWIGFDDELHVYSNGAESIVSNPFGSGTVESCGSGYPGSTGNGNAFVNVRDSQSDSVLAFSSNGGQLTAIELEGARRTTPCNLYTFSGRLYYDAFEPTSSQSNQLFSTDGSNVLQLTFNESAFNPIGGGTFSPGFQSFADSLLFVANTGSNSENYDLFTSNGTANGARLLKSFGANSGQIQPQNGIDYNGHRFFFAQDSLWRTDGTTEGTVQVLDNNNNPINSPTSFAAFDGYLYIAANNELLRTVSATGAPARVSGVTEQVEALFALPSRLLVAADNDLFTMVPEPTLSIQSAVSVEENTGSGNVTVQITVNPAVPYDVSAVVNTRSIESGNIALPGDDFVTVSNQSITIEANATQITVPVTLVNDQKAEQTESFELVLNNADGARLEGGGSEIVSTISITDSDQAVLAGNISIVDQNVAEDAGQAIVRVITGGTSEVDINFNYSVTAISATAGLDFTPTSGSATIPAGSGSVTFPVSIVDDTIDEEIELIRVTITPTAGLADLTPVTGSIAIIDNDEAPIDNNDPDTGTETPTTSGGGGGGAMTFTGLAMFQMMMLLVTLVRRRQSGTAK